MTLASQQEEKHISTFVGFDLCSWQSTCRQWLTNQKEATKWFLEGQKTRLFVFMLQANGDMKDTAAVS
jgi:hypothetical protein